MQNLLIKQSPTSEVLFIYNNEDVHLGLDFEIRKNLFQRALKQLDFDISKTAYLSKSNIFGYYLWCLTYDIHRSDGVTNGVLYYYIKEIIVYLTKTLSIKQIILTFPVPAYFLKILRRHTLVPIINKIPFKHRTHFFIRYHFGPLKRFFFSMVNMGRFLIRGYRASIKQNQNLALIFEFASNDDIARLRGLPDFLLENAYNVAFLDGSLSYYRFRNSDRKIFTQSFCLSILFMALFRSVRFQTYKKKFIQKNHEQIGDFSYLIGAQTIMQSLHVFYRELLMTRVIKKIKPEVLIVSSTFGDPEKRLPINIAYRLGIKTVLFSCRPFITSYRSEDRLIEPDLEGIHETSIGDNIYIFDTPSFIHLRKAGVEEAKINYYVPNLKKSAQEPISFYKKKLLLLFAHHSYNEQLIDLLLDFSSKTDEHSIEILYREHPNVKLSEFQIYKLCQIDKSLICISGVPWDALSFKNVIAITSNSTAGIDAVSRGSSLVWLPFTTLHSIQFVEIMESVGYVANNYQEAFNVLKKLLSNSDYSDFFAKQCFENYIRNISVYRKNI